MNPVVHAEGRRLEMKTVLTLQDIAQLDEQLRGRAAPAKSALWVEETPAGVSVRLVSIGNGQVLFAGNFDGIRAERQRTSANYNFSLDLGRRLRGESLSHVVVDMGLFPQQHFSLDVLEQFGPENKNLAGLTLSAWDPAVGIGVAYHRVIPTLWDLSIGGKVVMSVPTALITAVEQSLGEGGGGTELIDPIVTGVFIVRWPIPHTNFAVFGSASTNFRFAAGISLLNVSLLPFLP